MSVTGFAQWLRSNPLWLQIALLIEVTIVVGLASAGVHYTKSTPDTLNGIIKEISQAYQQGTTQPQPLVVLPKSLTNSLAR